MAQTNPQWTYGRFRVLGAVGPIITTLLLVIMFINVVILRKSKWFYNNVIKELVLFAFKDTIQETCSRRGATSKCCCCTHGSQLKFGDVAVKQDKEVHTILFLHILLWIMLVFAIAAFWDMFLFKKSEQCVCVPGLACFLANRSYSSKPVQCNLKPCTTLPPNCDVESLNNTMLECFELVLDYSLAGGVAAGLFYLTQLICQLVFTVLLNIWKRYPETQKLRYAQIILFLVLLAVVILVTEIPAIKNIVYDDVVHGIQFFAWYLTFALGILFPCRDLLEKPTMLAWSRESL